MSTDHEALYRLFDQAFKAASDERTGRQITADYLALRDALLRRREDHATAWDEGWDVRASLGAEPACPDDHNPYVGGDA